MLIIIITYDFFPLGGITNLFTKDEQSEIISELTPIMKRENSKRTLNHEIIMDYFLTRTCQNLHVVFCFSPVNCCFFPFALTKLVSWT